MVRYRDKISKKFVSEATWKRSKAHGGTRYVLEIIQAKPRAKAKGKPQAKPERPSKAKPAPKKPPSRRRAKPGPVLALPGGIEAPATAPLPPDCRED